VRKLSPRRRLGWSSAWETIPDFRNLDQLSLTSSQIESTIKLINIRMKGSEKIFR